MQQQSIRPCCILIYIAQSYSQLHFKHRAHVYFIFYKVPLNSINNYLISSPSTNTSFFRSGQALITFCLCVCLSEFLFTVFTETYFCQDNRIISFLFFVWPLQLFIHVLSFLDGNVITHLVLLSNCNQGSLIQKKESSACITPVLM